MEVWVEPRAEWKQMYDEIWRIERDFFYDPHSSRRESAGAFAKEYEPYLDRIATRDDLNYLFEQMLSEINVGHMFVGGGDIPEVQPLQVGLLGADYTIENGRYRFARVYNGENWNPAAPRAAHTTRRQCRCRRISPRRQRPRCSSPTRTSTAIFRKLPASKRY